ncbi:hypothetical protein X975_26143, partial [Stegodyphus mimosarum]
MDFREPAKLVSVSMHAKITFISVTVGITLLGFVARLLRRRRRNRPKSNGEFYSSTGRSKNQNNPGVSANGGNKQILHKLDVCNSLLDFLMYLLYFFLYTLRQ